jgi:hypothetical protein
MVIATQGQRKRSGWDVRDGRSFVAKLRLATVPPEALPHSTVSEAEPQEEAFPGGARERERKSPRGYLPSGFPATLNVTPVA